MKDLVMPPRAGGVVHEILNDVTSVVIVGANGSGKSRLGAWLETQSAEMAIIARQKNPQNDGQTSSIFVHRISAQRGLTIEEYVQPKTLEQAQRLTLYGSDHPSHGEATRFETKWQSSPTGHLLNNFQHVLAWAFAENGNAAIEFREQFRQNPKLNIPPGDSKLETAIRIWQAVMHQRELVAENNKIKARIGKNAVYAGREMSDGERVTLYLILQCLAAPDGSIVVLDEPELHLHQAIQHRLWDQVELARPDCVFVYITHDLGFAATRLTAKKIWIKSYDGNRWDWEEVPETEHFPESLTLQILGSRRPVLFVESDESGLDVAINRALYPDWLVIPLGSCETVINSTSALRNLPSLHHTEAAGIIDRDHRPDEQIESFRRQSVYSADVAEIENLFLLPDVIRAIAQHMAQDPETSLNSVQDLAFSALQNELRVQVNDRATFQRPRTVRPPPRPSLRVQVNDRATFQLQLKLNSFSGVANKHGNAKEFVNATDDHLRSVSPQSTYNEAESLFTAILAGRDYAGLLKHYNRKSLINQVAATIFGMNRDCYRKLILSALGTSSGQPLGKLGNDLRNALREYVPKLPEKAE